MPINHDNAAKKLAELVTVATNLSEAKAALKAADEAQEKAQDEFHTAETLVQDLEVSLEEMIEGL